MVSMQYLIFKCIWVNLIPAPAVHGGTILCWSRWTMVADWLLRPVDEPNSVSKASDKLIDLSVGLHLTFGLSVRLLICLTYLYVQPH